MVYTFTSNSSIATVLTQKDVEGNKRLIYFMSVSLHVLELNYPAIDKQTYVVYKVVEYFRPYLLKAHMIIFVPHPVVRTLLMQ